MKVMKKLFEVDEKDMVAGKRHSGAFGADLAWVRKLSDPAGIVLIEEWFPGTVSSRYGFWVPELQIMMRRALELDYWSSATGMSAWEHKKFIAEPGDVVLVDRGDQVIFKVLSTEESHRHLVVMMPALPYPAPAAPENQP